MIRYIDRKWIRNLLIAVLGLTVLAVLASYSRGGMVALIAMFGMLWLRSNKKVMVMVIVAALVVPAGLMMPDEWRQRMDISKKVTEDVSFLGRIEAWCMAVEVAKDRPLLGGGFSATQHPAVATRYGGNCDFIPDGLPVLQRAAHSNYFQVLGDHGWLGLTLYTLMLLSAFWRSQVVRRMCKGRDDLLWARDLITATQISFAGFLVGGAALSMAYFDGYFILIVIIIALQKIVNEQVQPARYSKRFTPRPYDEPKPVPAE